MRFKYKIGTFVKVAKTEDYPEMHGAVEAIKITEGGSFYEVHGVEREVSEAEIATAYREITPRKAKGTNGARTKKTKAESRASA